VARFDTDPQLNALAEALAALRRDAGLSQAEAGGRVAMTSQGWGLYEAGRRPGLFRPDVQRRLTAALGATPEALTLRIVATGPDAPPAASATGVESSGRTFHPAAASARIAGRERIPLSNDDLAPWAVSGVILEIDPGRWPRRDQGCVIDLVDGDRLVRLYDGADGERLYLRGGPEGLHGRSDVARSRVARVAAVVARIDE
jgi:transcriptional regulator with XRE-family HTH domain